MTSSNLDDIVHPHHSPQMKMRGHPSNNSAARGKSAGSRASGSDSQHRKTPRQLQNSSRRETPGDRLLSKVKNLEDSVLMEASSSSFDDSKSTNSSAIWRTESPFVAAGSMHIEGQRDNKDECDLKVERKTMESVEGDNNEHSPFKTPAKSIRGGARPSLSPLGLETPGSSSLPTIQREPSQRPQHIETDHDDNSVGNSTISTISSTESVFERLYRSGMEQNERRKKQTLRGRKSASSAVSSAAPASIRTPRRTSIESTQSQRRNRLSAFTGTQSLTSRGIRGTNTKAPPGSRRAPVDQQQTPRMATRSRNSIARSAHTGDDRSVSSRTSSRSYTSTASSVVGKHQRQSSKNQAPKPTPQPVNPVFARLYRNEKRTERLWKAPPPPPSPTPSTRSISSRQSVSSVAAKKSTEQRRQPKQATNSKRMATKSSAKGHKKTSTCNVKEDHSKRNENTEKSTYLAANGNKHRGSTRTEDIDKTVVIGTGDQSPTFSTTLTPSSFESDTQLIDVPAKERLSDPEARVALSQTAAVQDVIVESRVIHKESQSDAGNTISKSTEIDASIERDLAEIEAIGRELKQTSSSETRKTETQSSLAMTAADDSFEEVIDIVDTETHHSQNPRSPPGLIKTSSDLGTASFDHALADVEAIGKELRKKLSTTQANCEVDRKGSRKLRAATVDINAQARNRANCSNGASAMEESIDRDLAEIEAIGKGLQVDNSSDNHNASIDRDLAEIEAIGKELQVDNSSYNRDSWIPNRETTIENDTTQIEREEYVIESEVGNEISQQPGLVSCTVMEKTLDDGLAEIESIGKELKMKNSSKQNIDGGIISGDGDLYANEVLQPGRVVEAHLALENDPAASNQDRETFGTLQRQLFLPDDEVDAKMSSSTLSRQDNLESSPSPSVKRVSNLASEEAGTGFFSLDEGSGGLVLDYRGPLELISTPIRRRRHRNSPVDKGHCLTPHKLKDATTLTVQTNWRRYRGEIETANEVLTSCYVECTDEDGSSLSLPLSREFQAVSLSFRNLNDPYLELGLSIKEGDVVVAWETSVLLTHPQQKLRFSVLVEGTCRRLVWANWSNRKIAHRLLYAGLKQEYQRRRSDAALVIQTWFLLRGACIGKTSLEASNGDIVLEESDFSHKEGSDQLDKCMESTPTAVTPPQTIKVEMKLVMEHRAAATIQNWFRIRTLESALQDKSVTQEDLQRALVAISTPDGSSSNRSELEDARRVLVSSSSLESWLEPFETPPTPFAQWSPSGNMKEEWIERRAAALAIHNIVRAYLMGLRIYRRNRKASLIQACWRGHVQRCRYLRIRWAAWHIQRVWRSHYFDQQACGASIRIQSRWKAVLAVRRFQALVRSSITVQSTWRLAICRRRYLARLSVAMALQSGFRARGPRTQFVNLRLAVLTLQQRHRERSHRRALQTKSLKALALQSRWRSFIARRRWELLRYSTLVVQRNWRRHVDYRSFQQQRVASIRMQAFWRRCMALNYRTRNSFAAVQLQSQYRRYKAVLMFQQQVVSAITIQRLQRGRAARGKSMSLARQKLEKHNASIHLQSNCRRFLATRSLKRWKASAVQIQTMVRKSQSQQQYHNILRLSVLVQSMFRMKRDRRRFLLQISGLISFQTLIRGKWARLQLVHARAAAKTIQTHWRYRYKRKYEEKQRVLQERAVLQLQITIRRFSAMKKYKLQLAALIRLQSFLRCMQAKQDYLCLLRGIISAQARIRGYQVRSFLAQQVSGAVVLQRQVRGMSARWKLVQARVSATMVQAAWRGYSSRAVARAQAFRCEQAAMKIQSEIRSLISRRGHSQRLWAVIVIQSLFRKWKKQQEYRRLISGVVVLQSLIRRTRCQRSYENEVASVLKLQACVRGMMASWKMVRARVAVTMIQAAWRGYVIRAISKNNKSEREQAAVILQSETRRMIARHSYSKLISSAVTLQSYFRCLQSRRKFMKVVDGVVATQLLVRCRQDRRNFGLHLAAVVVVQCHARGMFARMSLLQSRISAIMIQAAWRGYYTRMIHRKITDRIKNEDAILTLQSVVRSFLSRRALKIKLSEIAHENAARLIQSIERGRISRASYRRTVDSIIVIQKHWRSALGRELYSTSRASAIMIQAHMRGTTMRSRVQEADGAARQIQLVWRGCRSRHRFLVTQKLKILYQQGRRSRASRRIQTIWRQWVLRRRIASARTIQRLWRYFYWRQQISRSSACIQSAVRRHHLVRAYTQKRRSAVCIQNYWRAARAGNAYNDLRVSVIMIQSTWRGHIERQRRDMFHAVATEIQKVWRGHRHYVNYNNQRRRRDLYQHARKTKFARKIQCAFRHWHAKQAGAHKAAIVLQSTWRGANARESYLKARVSSMIIQSLARGVQFRSRMRHSQLSAIRIQTHYRRLVAQKRYAVAHQAATKILCALRGCLARKKYRRAIKALVIIQSLWRRANARIFYTAASESVVLIQSKVRMVRKSQEYREKYLAAICIQTEWRKARARDELSRARVSAIMLQAASRGYLCRSRFSSVNMERRNWSAVMLQKNWRRLTEKRNYRKALACVIRIQSLVRMKQALTLHWLIHPTNNQAARTIQKAYSLWRMKLAVLNLKSSAVILRRGLKGQLFRHSARFALISMNTSIQTVPMSTMSSIFSPTNKDAKSVIVEWESAMMSAEGMAAIIIQATVRRMLARISVEKMFGASFDRDLFFDSFTKTSQEDSARLIQKAFRKRREAKANAAALHLQQFARWLAAQREYTRLESVHTSNMQTRAITIIQRVFRGSRGRNISARRRRELEGALQFQRIGRGWLAYNKFLVLRKNRAAQEARLLNQYVGALENESFKSAAKLLTEEGFQAYGPCMSKFASQTKASIEALDRLANEPLPSFVDQIHRLSINLSSCVPKSMPLSPKQEKIKERSEAPQERLEAPNSYSQSVDKSSLGELDTPPSPSSELCSPTKKVGTPVRSNKTMPFDIVESERDQTGSRRDSFRMKQTGSERSTDLAQAARDLLFEGRKAINDGNSKDPVAPKLNASVHLKQSMNDQSKKALCPVPGESFFEGESKEIPSPIKVDQEDWDWTEEW